MQTLTVTPQNLPTAIDDLAKFVLVGREKLVSVRAEIRAIDKLNLAEEVRAQKRDEALMLSSALLDAEVRIGELLKEIPKDPGGRPQKTSDTAVHSFSKPGIDATSTAPKPKLEVVKDLGFTPKQANRFETLANNQDIVEQVKAEARDNDDIPTRSRVLQLVQEKNRQQKQPPIDVDFRYDAADEINEAISKASTAQVDSQRLQCWASTVDDNEREFKLLMIDDAISNLRKMKICLTTKGR